MEAVSGLIVATQLFLVSASVYLVASAACLFVNTIRGR